MIHAKSNVSWKNGVIVVNYAAVCDQDLLSHVANFVAKDPLHLPDCNTNNNTKCSIDITNYN